MTKNSSCRWSADHTGSRLQVQTISLSTGLNTNWSDVAGSTSVNNVNVTINPANCTEFYPMVYPQCEFISGRLNGRPSGAA